MGQSKINIVVYIKMSSVMGFIWAIGFAAVLAETKVLWHIFEMSVPLQGIFIFISFVCKKRVFILYKKLIIGSKSHSRGKWLVIYKTCNLK